MSGIRRGESIDDIVAKKTRDEMVTANFTSGFGEKSAAFRALPEDLGVASMGHPTPGAGHHYNGNCFAEQDPDYEENTVRAAEEILALHYSQPEPFFTSDPTTVSFATVESRGTSYSGRPQGSAVVTPTLPVEQQLPYLPDHIDDEDRFGSSGICGCCTSETPIQVKRKMGGTAKIDPVSSCKKKRRNAAPASSAAFVFH